jgi:hypothetical protein
MYRKYKKRFHLARRLQVSSLKEKITETETVRGRNSHIPVSHALTSETVREDIFCR